MRFYLILGVISLLQTPACDLTGGPHKVQTRVELQLREYFPNSHVIAAPDRGTIFAVTCANGLGKPIIEEIAENLANRQGIDRLRAARRLPLKLSPYRFLVLVFDAYSIWIDTDTNQHSISRSDHQIGIDYNATCAPFSAPALSADKTAQ